MKHPAWTVVIGTLAAVTQLAVAATPADDEQRIRELDQQWSAAAGAKDAAKTAEFYTDDGAMMPFNGPIVNGREKIKDAWAGLMAKPGYALHFAPTTIVVARSHDLAYDIGTFELTLNDEHGKPMTMVGKYLVAWKKQHGTWKAAADCFNTDK